MSWLRIDDGFDSHPKILGLGTDTRRWTWQRILIYACRHGEAIVPPSIRDIVPKATPGFLEDCVQLGLLDVDKRGVMRVHNWARYQAGDPKKAARQRRWRHGGVDAPVDDEVDGQVDAHVDPSRVGARARPVPSHTQEPLALGTSEVLLEAGSYGPAANFTPDKSDPVGRLLAELCDADDHTEQVLRSFHLPEAAYERAREDTRAHGGKTGYAVAILRRIKDEDKLASDETDDAVKTNVQPADPVAAIRAMIHNGAIADHVTLQAELRAYGLNGADEQALTAELEQALTAAPPDTEPQQ